LKKHYFERWTNVDDVRAGDIIFENFDRSILFFDVVVADSKLLCRSLKNKKFKHSNNLGYKVDIQIFPLRHCQ